MKPICVICTEEFLADSKISVIHCGHPFHEDCLNNWLRSGLNNTCPQCRYIATPQTVIKKLFFTEPERVKECQYENDKNDSINNIKMIQNHNDIFFETEKIFKKYRDEINNNILNPHKYILRSRLNTSNYGLTVNQNLVMTSSIQIFRKSISQKKAFKAHTGYCGVNKKLIQWLPSYFIGFLLLLLLMFAYSNFGISSNSNGIIKLDSFYQLYFNLFF